VRRQLRRPLLGYQMDWDWAARAGPATVAHCARRGGAPRYDHDAADHPFRRGSDCPARCHEAGRPAAPTRGSGKSPVQSRVRGWVVAIYGQLRPRKAPPNRAAPAQPTRTVSARCTISTPTREYLRVHDGKGTSAQVPSQPRPRPGSPPRANCNRRQSAWTRHHTSRIPGHTRTHYTRPPGKVTVNCLDCASTGVVGVCADCGAAVCRDHAIVSRVRLIRTLPINRVVEVEPAARRVRCPICNEAHLAALEEPA
jgi:hypothetical protein